jgi:predicted acylesterase/phospholipase RssA
MSVPRESLKIYVLPVSGGWFAQQLMLLGQVYQARLLNAGGRFKNAHEYTPDICCASSGGNIAAYIAMAGDWTDNGIHKVSSHIHSKIFCRNWWPDYMTFLPTWILGIFAGAMFRSGYGANILLEKIYTPSTIQKTEIWTGTYNETTKTCELFCNKTPGETHVWPRTYNRFICKSMPLNFLSGNMNEIGKSIIASASIPFIFDSQTIGNNEYYDGGVMYASPLTPLQDEIYRIVAGINTPLDEMLLAIPIPTPTDPAIASLGITQHVEGLPRNPRKMQLTYFSGVHLDIDDTTHKPIGVSNKLSAIKGLTLSIALQDRLAAVNILTMIAGGRRESLDFKSYLELDITKLAIIINDLEPYDYVLYLYSTDITPLDMTCFQTYDVNKSIHRTSQFYGAHVWAYKPPV